MLISRMPSARPNMASGPCQVGSRRWASSGQAGSRSSASGNQGSAFRSRFTDHLGQGVDRAALLGELDARQRTRWWTGQHLAGPGVEDALVARADQLAVLRVPVD